MIEEERPNKEDVKDEKQEPETEQDSLLESNRIDPPPPPPVSTTTTTTTTEKAPTKVADPSEEDGGGEEDDEDDEEEEECPPGFQLAVLAEDDEESSPCADVDECSQKDKNGCSHLCINTEGSPSSSAPETGS